MFKKNKKKNLAILIASIMCMSAIGFSSVNAMKENNQINDLTGNQINDLTGNQINDLTGNQDLKAYEEEEIRKMEENSEIFQLGREFHEARMQDIEKEIMFAEYMMIEVDPKKDDIDLDDEDKFKEIKENIKREMCKPLENRIEMAMANHLIRLSYDLKGEIKTIENSFNNYKNLKDVKEKLIEYKENIKTFQKILMDSWIESTVKNERLSFKHKEEDLNKMRYMKFKSRNEEYKTSLIRQSRIIKRINRILNWFENNKRWSENNEI